jgi:DNA segregation ATPase FtsK/SpoIIIE-like protein
MMNKGSYRYLAALGLGLLLSEARAEYWTVDTLVKDFSQVSALIARGELQAAESSLNTLRQHTASNDVRIGQYQRELANAYLKQGRQQLQAGNAAAANATLSQGQQHLSAASPALKQEYQASLAASAAESGTKPVAVAAAKPQAQPAPAKVAAKPAVAAENPAERREDVERRLQEAEAIIAKKEAERARQQKLAEEKAAAEREARAQQAAAAQPAAAPAPAVAKVEAAAPVVAAAPRARLIDPAAASSSVPMPMLDANDRESLRNLLDQVAADVVAFDCAVRLEVREAKDYPFVAALLSARIKKLDPAFAPQFSPVLKPDQEPRLVLSPQSNG